MSLRLYSLAWWLATPLALAYLLWRSRRQPEYREHWAERWGVYRGAAARHGDGPLFWVHAVSVGETRAAQPLVAALLERHPDARLLLTHMTPTGRATGAELFARHGARVLQAYLPYDLAWATARFLRHWRPSLGIVMETELWPNLCAQARNAGVPLALVNARLSERSLRKGLRWRSLMEPALRSLVCVVAQTPADARRIERLGRADVPVAGNMKFDVSPAPALVERGRAWRALLDGRPVVLAASTRDGEEALVLDAWQTATHRPLLVIVPRHPQRFDEVAATLAARGLRFARRTALAAFDAAASIGGAAPGAADAVPLAGAARAAGAADGAGGASTERPMGSAAAGAGVDTSIDVLLGDSMGEMFAWYAMTDVAVLGGSLLAFGGQNLIEACALGVPVVMGPHTFNFEDAAAQAVEAGAALRVAGASEAVQAALALAQTPAQAASMSAKAIAFTQAHRGATGRTLALLGPWLPVPAGSRAS